MNDNLFFKNENNLTDEQKELIRNLYCAVREVVYEGNTYQEFKKLMYDLKVINEDSLMILDKLL